MPLTKTEIVETVVKWIAWLTALFIALKFIWGNLVKGYKYLQGSNERAEMLQHILDNQTYTQVVNRAIMNKFGLGYFRADLAGQTIEVGDVACKMLGYSEAELMGLNWFGKILSEDKSRVMDEFEDSVKYKADFETTYNIYCSDLSVKKIHVHAKHTGLGYFGILTEIK